MLLLCILALKQKKLLQCRRTKFSPCIVQNSIKVNMRLYQVGTFSKVKFFGIKFALCVIIHAPQLIERQLSSKQREFGLRDPLTLSNFTAELKNSFQSQDCGFCRSGLFQCVVLR